jgi:hypothetical protein
VEQSKFRGRTVVMELLGEENKVLYVLVPLGEGRR